jgi:hypothetical protein
MGVPDGSSGGITAGGGWGLSPTGGKRRTKTILPMPLKKPMDGIYEGEGFTAVVAP